MTELQVAETLTRVLAGRYTTIDACLSRSLDICRCERIFVAVHTWRSAVTDRASVWIWCTASCSSSLLLELLARVVQGQSSPDAQTKCSKAHVGTDICHAGQRRRIINRFGKTFYRRAHSDSQTRVSGLEPSCQGLLVPPRHGKGARVRRRATPSVP